MRLVAVVGASPGIGKSSLCARLARWLTADGLRVDHFEEQHVLSRSPFADVAAQFAATGSVEPRLLVDATARYLRAAAADGVDVAVVDSLVPFVPSLLAFGHDEATIAGAVGMLSARITEIPTLVVFLDGDTAVGLRRAADRDGRSWLSGYAGKLARYGLVPQDADLAALSHYLAVERATTLSVLRRQPWELVVVPDADRGPPDAVFGAARRAVARFLASEGGRATSL